MSPIMSAYEPNYQGPLPLSWEEMVAVEPRLARLVAEAEALEVTAEDLSYCRYGPFLHGSEVSPGFLNRLRGLVGWCSPHHDPFMSSMHAWEIAWPRVLAALPPCRCC